MFGVCFSLLCVCGWGIKGSGAFDPLCPPPLGEDCKCQQGLFGLFGDSLKSALSLDLRWGSKHTHTHTCAASVRHCEWQLCPEGSVFRGPVETCCFHSRPCARVLQKPVFSSRSEETLPKSSRRSIFQQSRSAAMQLSPDLI